jgi:hypothetical protein
MPQQLVPDLAEGILTGRDSMLKGELRPIEGKG